MSSVGSAGGETATGYGIELHWDPPHHLVTVRFIEAVATVTGEQARWMLEHVERWHGMSAEPFGYLVDCANIGNADVGWRADLAKYFRRRAPGQDFIAWYNLSTIVRIAAEMFVIAALGGRGRTFAAESAARAWLRERGIG